MAEKETLVDLLDEDKPVANQKFVCVSFVSPEKILKQKQDFCLKNLLRSGILKNDCKNLQSL